MSDAAIGGADTITTLNGDDIIFGGTDGDSIHGGEGQNIVIGDNGRIVSALADTPRFGGQPLTLGLIETMAFGVGGGDTINTLSGRDIIMGGHANDTITASDLTHASADDDNIVFGDDGRIVYDADGNSADIDLIVSLSTTAAGGIDIIDTGDGEDIILGGRYGDTIRAREGENLVIGDSGRITAANIDRASNAILTATTIGSAPQFIGQPITVGRIETIEPADGGNDTITTLGGRDIVLGGMADDTIDSGAGMDIVLGDNGFIDYVLKERPALTSFGDIDPLDIDIITTNSPTMAASTSSSPVRATTSCWAERRAIPSAVMTATT